MFLKKMLLNCLIVSFSVVAVLLASAQVKVDPKLPKYTPVRGVNGVIKSAGSDTMNNLMTLWAEGFQKQYPNVKPEIEGKGSGTAPVALIEGTAIFGPMSRDMKDKEIDDFEKKFGYKPTQLPTSLDVLSIYVNKDNPIKGFTFPQLDAIFSKNRLRGYPTDIVTWGQAGLTGDWANQSIAIYGRNSASGTYGFVKEHVMAKGDYKDTVKEQAGSSAVVASVAGDKYGIGYSGIGYITADVRAVPLAFDDKSEFVEPKVETAYSGDYPLSRYLYLTVNYKPKSQLDPLRREFIKYVYSQEGQEIVLKAGFYPITAEIAAKALQFVGVERL